MTKGVARALDECIAALAEGGVTIEECLAAHAEVANELRPLLELALSLRSAPTPTPPASAVARARAAMLTAQSRRRSRLGFLQGADASTRLRRTAAFGLACLALVLVAGLMLEFALPPSIARAATLVAQTGDVKVQLKAGSQWLPWDTGVRLRHGARIRTGPGAAASLAISQGLIVGVEADSEVEIIEFVSRPSGRDGVLAIRQVAGITVLGASPEVGTFSMGILTPHGVVTPRWERAGFRVRIVVRGESTRVEVTTGAAGFEGPSGATNLTAGESVVVGPEGALDHPIRPDATPGPMDGADDGSQGPSLDQTSPATKGAGGVGPKGDPSAADDDASTLTPGPGVEIPPGPTQTLRGPEGPQSTPSGAEAQTKTPTPQGSGPGSGGQGGSGGDDAPRVSSRAGSSRAGSSGGNGQKGG